MFALVLISLGHLVGPIADQSRLPLLPAADAWKALPRANPALPVWARTLAEPLPRTTGYMLELDAVHRAKNPLGPVLAATLRWAAADALDCEYARAYAVADLRRAGLSAAEVETATKGWKGLPDDQRIAVAFTRKLTTAGHAITDTEFADLLGGYGPARTVAIVHTIAHANFQNRVFLALGAKVEPGGPVPPFEVKLDAEARAKLVAPPRPPWAEVTKTVTNPSGPAKPEWDTKSHSELETLLASQKARKGRIPLPDSAVIESLPVESRPQARRVVWTNVSMGYQPTLTRAWFDTMGTFQQEAKFDRVFSNSFFWVVTRSNDCFY
jgi:alkylhydroperoxidase family enzyme